MLLLRLGQRFLRAHPSIAPQHRGGGLVERLRPAADRHARYFRNGDRPDEAVPVGRVRQIHATDLEVFAPDDVVPAGRLIGPRRAAGVVHGPRIAESGCGWCWLPLYPQDGAYHRKLTTLLVSAPSTRFNTCRATAAMMRLSSSP